MNAVLIGNDGTLHAVTVSHSARGSWKMGKTKLYLHNQTSGLAFLSPVDIASMQSERCSVFRHALPPPLDMYVYPETLVLIRYDPDKNATAPLAPDDLARQCSELVASSLSTDEVHTVYDVPAIPINYEVEDINEYLSEEEELESDEDESDEIEDDDDEWDAEEDDASTV